MAHKLDNSNDDRTISVATVADVLIFRPSDIVSVTAKDVDWDYATRDTFQTDSNISRCNGKSITLQTKSLCSLSEYFVFVVFFIRLITFGREGIRAMGCIIR